MHELAKTANEEVKLQNRMLDTLEEKVNDVQDHVMNLNERMKDTLDKVSLIHIILSLNSLKIFVAGEKIR